MRSWLLTAALLAVLACHETDNSQRSPVLPEVSSFIPVAPAPAASATPTPQPPSDDPLPAIPGGGGGGGGGCGSPTPPPVTRIGISIYSSGGGRLTLNSTPLVGPNAAYCRTIGYTDGRSFCPLRPDGHPDRLACEAAVVGTAGDTGRVGPTWTADGRACVGSTSGTYCVNHGSNQFLVFAYGSGTFRACVRGGVCGAIVVP